MLSNNVVQGWSPYVTGERLIEYASHSPPRITRRQCSAGILWAEDWLAGCTSLRHRGTTRTPRGGPGEPSLDYRAVARERFRKGRVALGPLYDITFRVCCEDMPARDYTDQRGETHQSAMPILRMALDVLVKFYDLAEDETKTAIEQRARA